MTGARDPVSDFVAIERTLADYFDLPGVTILCEFGEWYAEVDGRRLSLTGAAYAVQQALERQR